MAIYEVAISTVSKPPLTSGHQRIQEGDIVCIREPLGVVGKKEMNEFLWVLMDLTDEQVMNFQSTDQTTDPNAMKRKYKIDLNDLKTAIPSLDLQQAKDPNVAYQPVLNIDSQTGGAQAQPVPLTSSLVTDKTKATVKLK